MSDAFSLAIVGDGSSGKSSIINAFKSDGFSPNYKQTIGIDFYKKLLKIRDQIISLRVWDVGGQSINSKNLNKYISNSNIIFLNYDITNADSFRNLDDWLIQIRKYCTNQQHIYLIGNKIDLITIRQVTDKQHTNFIQDNNLHGNTLLHVILYIYDISLLTYFYTLCIQTYR